MAFVLLPAGLPAPTHQGGSARFFRRLGGAIHGALAGGVALAGRLRRPATAQPSRTPPKPRDPTAPLAPRQPRKPRAAAPAQPARPGWLARWFGRKPRQPTPVARSRLPYNDAGFFTEETHPELSPEARAFFNTPVEDCDPEMLQVALVMLAQHIADTMGPALGMDAEALLATLYDRLAVPAPTGPDAAPPDDPAQAPEDRTETPAAIPATPTDAASDAPPNSLPATQGTDDAPKVMATSPDAASAERDRRDNQPLFDASRPFHRRHRTPARQHRSPPRRCSPSGPQRLPLRKLCYAACAGPP